MKLGIAAYSVIKRLGNFEGDEIPAVLIGSVFQLGKSDKLLAKLKKTVQSQYPDAKYTVPDKAPVYGAVLLAMDRIGMKADASIYSTFNFYGRRTVYEQ
ncbi:hypothetical protein DUZ99_15250 [Xylanibacillus composti]|uniref:Uncharacterized protein n=2 Tax=Xylanibacillus composti TaxID=1572762 RepID=A0A8J4H7T0_9BACL|nr:hypothetical protein [Xylanibacillus composti]MDT9726338.1 hypothetical protein [Xylanibacillus composti]GIQ70554.1 hypothetical protein XYCOK13_33780 [Xylanibacillus composti]